MNKTISHSLILPQILLQAPGCEPVPPKHNHTWSSSMVEYKGSIMPDMRVYDTIRRFVSGGFRLAGRYARPLVLVWFLLSFRRDMFSGRQRSCGWGCGGRSSTRRLEIKKSAIAPSIRSGIDLEERTGHHGVLGRVGAVGNDSTCKRQLAHPSSESSGLTPEHEYSTPCFPRLRGEGSAEIVEGFGISFAQYVPATKKGQ